MAISYELMGPNVVMDDFSQRAYAAMGCFTNSVTQDRETMGGFFGLTTYPPISIIKYGDSFTWHKYSFRVLPPEIPRQRKNGLEKTYQNALLEFHQTDVEGIIHFQPFEEIKREIASYIEKLIPNDVSSPARKAFFNELVAFTDKGSEPPSDEKLLLPSQEGTEGTSKSESIPHSDMPSPEKSSKSDEGSDPTSDAKLLSPSQEGTKATSKLESMPHSDKALMSPPDESSK
jgi:hypothetical protein